MQGLQDMQRRFMQCDVFSDTAFRGNPLAVVVDGDGLTTAQMQEFANWTNLSETTFLLKPEDPQADYKVRIFTPEEEMPFAGHPTLGSCAAWIDSGGKPKHAERIIQECNIGLVDVILSGNELSFVAPPTEITPMLPTVESALLQAMHIDSASLVRSTQLNNGPHWQVLELASSDDVLAIELEKINWPDFNLHGFDGSAYVGLVGRYKPDDTALSDNGPDYEVRLFAPTSGIAEDPVTGSLNAAIACWYSAQGQLPDKLIMSQGTALGRLGRLSITRELAGSEQRILIGGATRLLIRGHVEL